MKFFEKLLTLNTTEVKTALQGRFAKNLKFFEHKDKDLLGALSTKPTMFGLIADDNGINILNIATNTLVYPTDENGRHLTIDACREMAKNPTSHTKWKRGFELNPFYMMVSSLQDTTPIAKNIFGLALPNGLNPTDIYIPSSYLPFAFMYGLGGGFVLEAMLEEYEKIDGLFIYEPFENFFAISAYFVDYEELFSKVKNLFLKVGDAPSNADVKFFLPSIRFLALYPRLELTMFDTQEIQTVKHAVSIEAESLFRGFGSYEDEMIGWRNSAKNTSFSKLSHKVLKSCNPKKIDFPICVVGNGGSLDESIEFLRQNQNNLIIFSAGTALRSLLKNGIKPDFQIEIERTDYLHGILREAGIDDIDMIAANVVDPNTIATTSGEKLLFFRDFTASSFLNAPKAVLPHAAPFVGNAAFSLAVRMSKTVVLCGMDVGYKRHRAVHSKDSIYEESEELPQDSIPATANFEGSEIYSNGMFNLSRWVLEFAAHEQKSSCKVFNMSDGALVAGATPCKEFHVKARSDKEKAKKQIKEFFSNKPTEVFGKNGVTSLDKDISGFKQELMKIFLANVSSKEEFFAVIAAFDAFTAKVELERRTVFLLFGGSVRHIVLSFCVAVLHSNPSDFKTFYDLCVKALLDGYDTLVGEFKKEEARGRVGSLLSGIKAP